MKQTKPLSPSSTTSSSPEPFISSNASSSSKISSSSSSTLQNKPEPLLPSAGIPLEQPDVSERADSRSEADAARRLESLNREQTRLASQSKRDTALLRELRSSELESARSSDHTDSVRSSVLSTSELPRISSPKHSALYSQISLSIESASFQASFDIKDVKQKAKEVTNGMIDKAASLINHDVRAFFFYKCPEEFKPDMDSDESSTSTADTDMEWASILTMNSTVALDEVELFLSLWKLSFGTKYTVEPHGIKDYGRIGFSYLFNAIFSKPTKKCPNPLAVCTVHFAVHVPKLLPQWYPAMLTYRFEGQRNFYHGLGDRAPKSMRFQQKLIDMTLQSKLAFYAQLVECANPGSDEDSNKSDDDESCEESVSQLTSSSLTASVD